MSSLYITPAAKPYRKSEDDLAVISNETGARSPYFIG